MASIKMTPGYRRDFAEISCNFIDHYMMDCPQVYPLIYIFSMKKLQHGEDISTAQLAAQFNITESDVRSAWKHWHDAGVVELDGANAITFLPVPIPQKKEDPTPYTKPTGSRPHYTNEELSAYRQQSRDIARLFDRAQKTLGKMFNSNDLGVIFSFHDWLQLPLDVVEYLLSYCAENGHRNLRYIEKCALDWADNEIDDIEKALNYVQAFNKNYRTILHYMGQTTSYPTPSHRKYMDKWLFQWNMPLDLIMEACDRSVAEINKPKFNYVDKILSEWHKKGIVDIEGIKAADAEFLKNREISTQPKKAVVPKTNRFVNFTQRENDHSRYEQLERAYLEQKLERISK